MTAAGPEPAAAASLLSSGSDSGSARAHADGPSLDAPRNGPHLSSGVTERSRVRPWARSGGCGRKTTAQPVSVSLPEHVVQAALSTASQPSVHHSVIRGLPGVARAVLRQPRDAKGYQHQLSGAQTKGG